MIPAFAPNAPAFTPSLNLDFTTGVLDPRITFTRASTATYTGSDGLIKTAAINAPRFDYNPVTLQPKGLLIEEQRTNLVTYSDQFDNAAWGKVASTVTANATTAPDNTATADSVIATATTAEHYLQSANTNYTSGLSYTISCFVKTNGLNWIRLAFPSTVTPTTERAAWFDIQNGVLGTVQPNVSASIVSVGNGWYRCSITRSATVSAVNGWFFLITNADNVTSFAGDGTSGIYLWGAQLEAGSFPTSYIPTVASQVTRSADSASMTGSNFSSWFRPDQGTIMAISQRPYSAVSSNAGVASLFADYLNMYLLNYYTSTNVEAYVKTNGSAVADITASSWSANTDTKHVLGYAVNDFAASLNGSAVGTDTSGALPVGINSFYIGVYQYSTNYYLNGTIKRIAYYPKRLSNSQLRAITS